MNGRRESLKAELTQAIQKGRDATKLVELHKELLGKIKEGLLAELAMSTSLKQRTVKKFLWFTWHEETRGGLEHIESLQADLRVVLGYESLLEGTQIDAESAKINLESLNNQA